MQKELNISDYTNDKCIKSLSLEKHSDGKTYIKVNNSTIYDEKDFTITEAINDYLSCFA